MKEYKVIGTGRKQVEDVMNQMAKEGWEVVDVTAYSALGTDLIVTFAREKQ